MTTDELLLKTYYQVQDEMDTLPVDIALEVAQLRLKSNWTQEAEDEIITSF